ncbi:hypothetical protein L1987_45569 [Smallanthus sonchifolius]|uniref:Uncharacterized protein n=1 Tax=Smallanthus sonchifolius TaxID=185202 RepID=A0ACB9FXF7_9ASTR|nr:hypothetical protein L1987_45569 [Smallanthus sonchifolius]
MHGEETKTPSLGPSSLDKPDLESRKDESDTGACLVNKEVSSVLTVSVSSDEDLRTGQLAKDGGSGLPKHRSSGLHAQDVTIEEGQRVNDKKDGNMGLHAPAIPDNMDQQVDHHGIKPGVVEQIVTIEELHGSLGSDEEVFEHELGGIQKGEVESQEAMHGHKLGLEEMDATVNAEVFNKEFEKMLDPVLGSINSMKEDKKVTEEVKKRDPATLPETKKSDTKKVHEMPKNIVHKPVDKEILENDGFVGVVHKKKKNDSGFYVAAIPIPKPNRKPKSAGNGPPCGPIQFKWRRPLHAPI